MARWTNWSLKSKTTCNNRRGFLKSCSSSWDSRSKSTAYPPCRSPAPKAKAATSSTNETNRNDSTRNPEKGSERSLVYLTSTCPHTTRISGGACPARTSSAAYSPPPSPLQCTYVRHPHQARTHSQRAPPHRLERRPNPRVFLPRAPRQVPVCHVPR